MKRLMVFICFVSFLIPQTVMAESFDNRAALDGLKTVKVYFDVNVGDAKQLMIRLDLLSQTVDQIDGAGIRPEVIVGIRGGATKLVTRGTDYFKSDDVQYSERIKKRIAEFASRGFAIEQCAIAARFLDVDLSDMLPEIASVANGYVSMIGYQNKGYAVVPMD